MSTEQNATLKNEERKRREVTFWAVVLIWAGLVFAADSMGVLPRVASLSAWNWVFLGAGLFALIANLYRATSPDRPDPKTMTWNLVWAAILLILGLGGLVTAKIVFPLILLLIGVALLGTSMLHTDKSLA